MNTSRFKLRFEKIVRKNRRFFAGFIVGLVFTTILFLSLQERGFVYNIINKGESRVEREIRSKVHINEDADLSILTISDGELLKEVDQDIFANAKKGDKLIIFENKGIIYRPQNGKIINIVTLKI